MKKTIQVIELFAGIGAFSQVLKNLKISHKILFISEINKVADEIFQTLHRNTKNFGDIRNIMQKIVKFKDKCDILCFGSPCQDFSKAGLNKGGKQNSNTRSSLLWEAVKIIEIIQPKIIIFENVSNLKTRHNLVLKNFKSELKKNNYMYWSRIINSLNYNIPQNRSRLFLVGLKKDVFTNSFKFSPRTTQYKKQKAILETFLNIKNFSDRKMLGGIKLEHNYTNFQTWNDKKGNKNGSYNRAWKIDRHSGAITYSNRIKITDNNRVSLLTAKESWLLMGFSEEQFNKTKKHQLSEQKLISLAGNSVVVNVLENIVKRLPLNEL